MRRSLTWVGLGVGLIVVMTMAGCEPRTFLEERLKVAERAGPVEIAVLLGFATLVSEDLACVSGGVLAARNLVSYPLAVMGCLLGIWLGDLGLYGLGRWGRAGLLDRAPVRWFISRERVERGRRLFERHGGKLVFTSRFFPGSRLPIYVAAGAVRYPFLPFAGYMALACLLWTPLLVGFAMKVGDALLGWLAIYEKAAWLVFVGVIVVVWVIARILEFGLTHRGRRLLHAKWRRLCEWEFWPMWAFYPPVFLRILQLAIRHRSLSVCTLANPGMPLGGLALESKSEILGAFGDGEIARERIARWLRLDPAGVEIRMTALRAFLAGNSLDYPVVIKPDVGERGQGVAVVNTEAEAEAYLGSCMHPVIVQEYVPGLEFGVFYVRHPREESGRLLSITEKSLPEVIGDGVRSMEHLILDDERAVRMAEFFLGKWAHHLDEIPGEGEVIRLSELGTHCRGAIFRDGRGHATEALREAVDRLSREFEGFHFGRYDLKVPSVEDLEAGRNWKILELNGVTSESTHIYSPGYPLARAWRDLGEQWRIAFEIGAAHRDDGVRVPDFSEIWRTIRDHRRHEWFEAPPKSGMT